MWLLLTGCWQDRRELDHAVIQRPPGATNRLVMRSDSQPFWPAPVVAKARARKGAFLPVSL